MMIGQRHPGSGLVFFPQFKQPGETPVAVESAGMETASAVGLLDFAGGAIIAAGTNSGAAATGSADVNAGSVAAPVGRTSALMFGVPTQSAGALLILPGSQPATANLGAVGVYVGQESTHGGGGFTIGRWTRQNPWKKTSTRR